MIKTALLSTAALLCIGTVLAPLAMADDVTVVSQTKLSRKQRRQLALGLQGGIQNRPLPDSILASDARLGVDPRSENFDVKAYDYMNFNVQNPFTIGY